MKMQIQVIKCSKSYQFANMWVITYTTSKKDFFTDEEVVSEPHAMFSLVEVQPGSRTVVKEHTDDYKKFWIKEVIA